MPSSPHAAAWTRLGALLRDRRIELDPRYRNRRLFVSETGLSYSVTSNIETGVRDDYGADTLKAVERAYRWQPGSIRAVLDGGDPTPVDPAVRVYEASVSVDPPTNADHVDDELAQWTTDALRHDVDVREWDLNDRVERELFCHPSFNWREKEGMRGAYRAYRAEARERQRREAGDAPATNGTPY